MFVIYSQNKMVCEVWDIMTSDVNYIDFFQFFTLSYKKLFSMLISQQRRKEKSLSLLPLDVS